MDDVLARADRNMVGFWSGLVQAAGGVVEERDGVTLMASGVPLPMFNPVFLSAAPADPAAVVAAVRAFYGERGLRFVLHFREAQAPGVAEACAAAGLVEHWRMPLMVLDPIPPTGPPAPDGLTVEVVDAAGFADYLGALSGGFGIPPEMISAYDGGAMVGIEGFTGLLGRVGGTPVATSGVFVDGETAGVYNVSTHPDHRRCGYGEALTAAAARVGAEAGCTRSILQATEAGEPVYRRMGYATPDHYRQFQPASD